MAIPTETHLLTLQEAGTYKLPAWLVWPLVQAESSFNPDSGAGTTHQGLLSIGPTYPGVGPGTNRMDPKTNLDLGFAQLQKTYQAHPEWQSQSLSNFENIISNSGFDTFGGWSTEDPKDAANYVKNYQSYAGQGTGPSASDIPGVKGVEDSVNNLNTTVKNATSFLSDPVGNIASNYGWKIAVFLLALVLLIGAGTHIFERKEGKGIVPVPVPA